MFYIQVLVFWFSPQTTWSCFECLNFSCLLQTRLFPSINYPEGNCVCKNHTKNFEAHINVFSFLTKDCVLLCVLSLGHLVFHNRWWLSWGRGTVHYAIFFLMVVTLANSRRFSGCCWGEKSCLELGESFSFLFMPWKPHLELRLWQTLCVQPSLPMTSALMLGF